MPRFQGTPVEQSGAPRFKGVVVEAPAAEPKVGYVEDMARSGASGVRQGVESTMGMFGDAANNTEGVARWIAEKFGASPEIAGYLGKATRVLTGPFALAPSTDQLHGATSLAVGDSYEPQTVPGEYARTVGQFLPAAAAGPGNLTRRLLMQTLLPALGSETAGQFTKGSKLEPYARIIGALLTPLAASGVEAGFRRMTGPSGAERAFARAAGADAVDDIGARMADLGDNAMPMDLGPNLQRQAGAVAATPGRGQEMVRSAITQRQGAAGDRVTGYLDDVLGGADDMTALADDIVRQRAAAAQPLYRQAYQEGVGGVMTPEIERMASSPMFGDAMRKAATSGQDRAVLEGYGAFNPRVTVTPDGRVLFNKANPGGSPLYPDLQFWDYVKRNLDDVAGEAVRAGRNEQASIARTLASRLRDELDNAVPSYKAARDAYAGQSAIKDALEEGQKVFANAVTPGQLKAQLAGMSEGERQAFVQGARAQIANAMGTARNDALAARSMFQKGYNQEKLALLLGEDTAASLLKSLDAETAFTRTRDIVTGNSETAARQAAQQELAGSDTPGLVKSLLNMKFGDAAAVAGDKMLGRVGLSMRNRRAEEIAKLLVARDPGSVADVLSRVAASGNNRLADPRSALIATLAAIQNNRKELLGQ